MASITDVREVSKTTSQAEANQKLAEGWILLGLFDRREGADQWVEYHLGKVPEVVDPLQNFTLGKHVTG